jgi:hypothetical protein
MLMLLDEALGEHGCNPPPDGVGPSSPTPVAPRGGVGASGRGSFANPPGYPDECLVPPVPGGPLFGCDLPQQLGSDYEGLAGGGTKSNVGDKLLVGQVVPEGPHVVESGGLCLVEVEVVGIAGGTVDKFGPTPVPLLPLIVVRHVGPVRLDEGGTRCATHGPDPYVANHGMKFHVDGPMRGQNGLLGPRVFEDGPQVLGHDGVVHV